MINFRIYNMNKHELLATTMTREDALIVANCDENINKRIMIVKHDSEKGDEIVNRTTGDSCIENLSCMELKKEIVKLKSKKRS